jgi:hypothetical protein
MLDVTVIAVDLIGKMGFAFSRWRDNPYLNILEIGH